MRDLRGPIKIIVLISISIVAFVEFVLPKEGAKSLPVGVPDERWETITGIQQDIKLAVDIDANSIQRTSDGASASVTMRLNAENTQRVTYICRSPESGVPGAVISNGHVVDLPAGSTSEAVMRRICYGPLQSGQAETAPGSP